MINKLRSKDKSSFRQRIFISNITMVIIIVVCIASFNIINSISVDKYNEAVVSLKTLSSLYENVDSASSYVKDYLYTENKETLDNYKVHMNKALEDAKTLKSLSQNEDRYRFVMLNRMIISYEEISGILIAHFDEDKSDYKEMYNAFLNAGVLIENTSVNYYNLTTKVLNKQLDDLKSIKNTTIIASVLLLGMLIVWLVYYSQQLTNSITNPIRKLLKNINKVKEGEYDLSQVSSASEEMGALCDAIDEMAHAVKNNIETTQEKAKLERQLLEWKNENLKKEELLVQSELKMLQNQINPHFLFNTLNMIYKLAIQEGAEDAANILIKTSQLLRYGLDKQSRLSDIKSEVEILKNYIEIQEVRLGERVSFTLTFENEETIGRIQIPGMILQPLVENAIKHGLNDCMEDGEIGIQIAGNKKEVRIVVSDNGKGMHSSKLEAFILNDYHKTEGNHLGLYNVVKRLQMYYHDNVEISINSDVDCGFEFTIQINLDS